MAKTKSVGGKEYPASDFLYVGDPEKPETWSILKNDEGHVRDAMARWDQDEVIPSNKKATLAAKLARIARRMGIDPSGFEKKYVKSSEHGEPDYSNGWIEIFRAGDYTKQGKAKITPADLDRVVANYDPSYHEAPVVIGHPESDGPAWGWIADLKREGDFLLAREAQVDPAFAEMRIAGKFKKRSAAFYRDANGSVCGLRHVGWLGAQPPAVKGLQDVAFDDHGQDFIEMTEEVNSMMDEKTLREKFMEFFGELIGKKSGSAAAFSEDDVKRIASDAVVFATQSYREDVKKLETQLKEQAAKFAEREQKIATSETRQRAATAVVQLKDKGRWIPAFEKMGLPLVFAELAKHTDSVEFGEGDAKKKLTPLEIFTQFLEGLPKIVPEGRVVTAQQQKPGSVRFSEGSGVRADVNSIALNDAAEKRMKEKNITYAEALGQVAAEHPELCVAGGTQAGAV